MRIPDWLVPSIVMQTVLLGVLSCVSTAEISDSQLDDPSESMGVTLTPGDFIVPEEVEIPADQETEIREEAGEEVNSAFVEAEELTPDLPEIPEISKDRALNEAIASKLSDASSDAQSTIDTSRYLEDVLPSPQTTVDADSNREDILAPAEEVFSVLPERSLTDNATDNPGTIQEDTRIVSVPREVQEESLDERTSSEVLLAAVDQEFAVVVPDIGWIFVSSTGIPVRLLRSVPQSENTAFFFIAQETGTVQLSFERYDLSSGSTFFHSVQVTVADAGDSPEQTLVAVDEEDTDSSMLTESMELSYANAAYEEITSVLEDSKLEKANADTLYDRIAADIMRGAIAESLEILRTLLVYDTENRDRTYFFLGQAYEAFSPEQNIDRAINFYRLLKSQYPLSSYYQDALGNMEYLKRNFIQIR